MRCIEVAQSRSAHTHTHTNLQGVAYTFSDNLVYWKLLFFRTKSVINSTILKLEQCFLSRFFKFYSFEAITMFFIVFRISYSTNITDCIFWFWNVKGYMRRTLKIFEDLKKSQDVFYNICRVRDSKHNKKKHCYNFTIVRLIIDSKFIRKLRFFE